MVRVKFKVRAENAEKQQLFLFGDGTRLGDWNVQKSVQGVLDVPTNTFLVEVDLEPGHYSYRYGLGVKCGENTFIDHCEMDWASDAAGAKPRRSISIPENSETEILIDDGSISESKKFPLLEQGFKRLVLKLSNQAGSPVSRNVGMGATLKFVPSALDPYHTSSLKLFSPTTHTSDSVVLTEGGEYFHIFDGIVRSNSSLKMDLTIANLNFSGEIRDIDKLPGGQSVLSVDLDGGPEKVTLRFDCLVVTALDSFGSLNSRLTRSWQLSRPVEGGHRGCGNSFTTRNRAKELERKFMANVRENSLDSFDIAKSQGNADLVEFDVTLTRDKLPIIYHDLSILFNGVPTPLADLTMTQLCNGNVQDMSRHTMSHDLNFDVDDNQLGTPQGPCPTLADCFSKMTESLSFNVEVKWPLPGEFDKMDCTFGNKDFFNINDYCDEIIRVMRNSESKRGIVLSTFDPDVCLCLKIKQTDFDVVQLVYGDTGFYADHHDTRCKRIGWAAAYAKLYGFTGINTIVHDPDQNPEIVTKLHGMGLTLGIYGDMLNYAEVREKMRGLGLDLIIYDNIHIYNRPPQPQ